MVLQGNECRSPRHIDDSCDPAAFLCAFLMAKRGWSLCRIAQALSIPPLVVEECVRNGVSSEALRGHLAQWVSECGDRSLPPALVEAVVQAATAGSSTSGEVDCEQEGDPLVTLDPVTRAYFAELNAGVGHGFISILSDPCETKGGFNFGSWLGGVVAGALEQRGNARRPEMVSNVETSSESLHARYSHQEDFSSYVQLVSLPYVENRDEGHLDPTAMRIPMQGDPEEDITWPAEAPEEFFDPSYDPVNEIHMLEERLRDRGHGSNDYDGAMEVTADSFREDFEEIESRMKELRRWESLVENCLQQHVWSRSEQFFNVSREFSDRAAEARRTLEDLKQTRADVNAFGTNLVQEMMMIAQHYRAHKNLSSLRDVAEMMAGMLSQVAKSENWVSLPERDMSELPAMVDSCCFLQRALQIKGYGPATRRGSSGDELCSLSRLVAFKDVPQRVVQMRETLCSLIMKETEEVLVPFSDGLPDESQTKLLFKAVSDMGMWPAVLRQGRDRLMTYLWATVRETFIGFVMGHCKLNNKTADDILTSAVSVDCSPEEKLDLLKHSDACKFPLYMQLLNAIIEAVLDFVKHVNRRWAMLVLEQGLQRGCDTKGETLLDKTKRYLTSLVSAAEGCVAMLLTVRSGQGKAPTSVRDLETCISSVYAFIQKLTGELKTVATAFESVGHPQDFASGKQLRSAMTRLAKEHFQSHHMENIEKLRVTLENEIWQPQDFDPDFQSRVDVVFRSDAASVAELRGRAVFFDSSSVEGPAKCPTQVATEAATASEAVDGTEGSAVTGVNDMESVHMALRLPSTSGSFDGRVVSVSVQVMLELLREYDDYLGRFPFLAVDVMGKVHDILKLYNSQCASLLLGAVAVENGSLECITVQHMAVASQNLGLLYDGIPLILNRWQRTVDVEKLSPSTAADMARVRKDCFTYRFEFFSKITGLVREKVDSLGALEATKWKTSGHEWLMVILRETARLMRTLKPLLPASDRRAVFVPLLGTFALTLRTVTMSPDVDEELRAIIRPDVMLFKANVENFGFDVLQCVGLCRSPEEAVKRPLDPCTPEEAVVAWFFGI